MAFGFKSSSNQSFSQPAPSPTQDKFIPTSTGEISKNYEVIDTIFALDSNTQGWFSGAKPEEAFAGVKEKRGFRMFGIPACVRVMFAAFASSSAS